MEWARFLKYARGMQELRDRGDLHVLSPEVFSVLQLCAINDPFFPHLKTLELLDVTEEFIPFIPLFLSPRTTYIEISFLGSDSPRAMVVSMATTLPVLCPNLREIILDSLPKDPMIIAGVSGMLLASNLKTLRAFHADSPLTEEAREVVYRLPDLRELTVVIERDASPTSVVLPNLIDLIIKYDHDGDWLRMFHGATLGKLEAVTLFPGSEQIGDILETFERNALAMSAQNTLMGFYLYTTCSWSPNYSSLLPFTQLTGLIIGFSCDGGCSSTVDDDIITNLARTMPKLETLQLGGPPCREIPTGVTAKGLVILANHCPDLSTLRIHFQVASLVTLPGNPKTTSNVGFAAMRRGCALTILGVGEIPMEESVLMVATTLVRIFPRIESINYEDENWREVLNAIRSSREIVDRWAPRSNRNDASPGTTPDSGS